MEQQEHSESKTVHQLPMAKVFPDPKQPRKSFKAGPLERLKKSIEANGLYNPIDVHETPDGVYLIVCGERRWRCHQELGRETIAAHILPDNTDTLLRGLDETRNREQLNPIEEAEGLRELKNRGMTQKEIADRIGEDEFFVSTRLSLLRLSKTIQQHIIDEQLSLSVGILMARHCKEPQEAHGVMMELADRAHGLGKITIKSATEFFKNREELKRISADPTATKPRRSRQSGELLSGDQTPDAFPRKLVAAAKELKGLMIQIVGSEYVAKMNPKQFSTMWDGIKKDQKADLVEALNTISLQIDTFIHNIRDKHKREQSH